MEERLSKEKGIVMEICCPERELNVWTFLKQCVVKGSILSMWLLKCTFFFDTDSHTVSIICAGEAQD